MRKPANYLREDKTPAALRLLYQRIDCNAKTFGMSPSEVKIIKKECKIAFQHKIILEKVERKKQH